jgi:hypothetical protein
MNPQQIRCPKCGSRTIAQIGGRFSMPNVDDGCEFLIEQKRTKGKIDEWMCPTLKAEVERVLYGREPNAG